MDLNHRGHGYSSTDEPIMYLANEEEHVSKTHSSQVVTWTETEMCDLSGPFLTE